LHRRPPSQVQRAIVAAASSSDTQTHIEGITACCPAASLHVAAEEPFDVVEWWDGVKAWDRAWNRLEARKAATDPNPNKTFKFIVSAV